MAVLAIGLSLPAHTVAAPGAGRSDDRAGPRSAVGSGDAGDSSAALSAADTAADARRPLGTVNPLSIANPLCKERLRRQERRNCRVTGSPEGRYPTSNYGFDINVDTGIDNISGNFASLLAQLANVIWTACLFVLNIVLTVLGWAFSLSPFTDNSAMAQIDTGLERFYRAFTSPFLVVAMVAVGAYALYRGLARGQGSAAIAGTVGCVALMLIALWVIHEPRSTVGVLSDVTNKAATVALAAPQSGSLDDPVATYGEATAEVWNAMTVPAFSVLNFSDVDWALSKPDAELLETSKKWVCLDAAYLKSISPDKWQSYVELSDGELDADCGQAADLAPAPQTNAEIWLRSSAGSAARKKLWEEHADGAPYSSYLAIQGEGGALVRLGITVIIALGLLGGILLLAWLALRIFMQTAVAFVLALTAPLALFLPAFGERGRAGFLVWGTSLLGAIVSKLVYAALLSAVLFATSVIASLVDGGGGLGATTGMLAMSALWWAVFLNRESILSFISVPGHDTDREGSNRLGRVLGLHAIGAVGQRLIGGGDGTGAVRRGAAALRDHTTGDRSDRREAASTLARDELDRRGRRRLDAKLEGARQLLAGQTERREQLASTARQRTDALKHARAYEEEALRTEDPRARRRLESMRADAVRRERELDKRQRELAREISSHAPSEARAAQFVGRAEHNETVRGRRWQSRDLADAREAIRSEADRPVDDPVHAWRAGMRPDRYAALRGAERERVHAAVAQELRADRAAFGAIPARPDGLVDARASRRFRRDTRTRPGGEQALHRARVDATSRRRAHARHRPSRRGVSR